MPITSGQARDERQTAMASSERELAVIRGVKAPKGRLYGSCDLHFTDGRIFASADEDFRTGYFLGARINDFSVAYADVEKVKLRKFLNVHELAIDWKTEESRFLYGAGRIRFIVSKEQSEGLRSLLSGILPLEGKLELSGP
jgi:hypothetical protein